MTILEKDATPPPATAEEAGRWRRTATPQAGHSHAFLAGARVVLDGEAPDVLAALAGCGIREAVLAPPESVEGPAPSPDEVADLVVLNSRRSTFEWALRSVVEREPGIVVRRGVGAIGLLLADGPGSRVTGVATAEGPVDADVVVDAAGKRSPLRGWSTSDPAPDRDVACGISYLTRFYRLVEGEPRR